MFFFSTNNIIARRVYGTIRRRVAEKQKIFNHGLLVINENFKKAIKLAKTTRKIETEAMADRLVQEIFNGK